MIETTTTYTTSDGRKFTELARAEAHEAALERLDDVTAYLATCDGAARTQSGHKCAILGWLAWDAYTGEAESEA